MEASAIHAMEQSRLFKEQRLAEHKQRTSQERGCRGLTDKEYLSVRIKQKSSYQRSKKFTCNKHWRYLDLKPLKY